VVTTPPWQATPQRIASPHGADGVRGNGGRAIPPAPAHRLGGWWWIL